MTDKEKIMLFEKHMRDKSLGEKEIKFNLMVVDSLVNQVLFYFQEGLETIDTYCFEEFTDMISTIDQKFGGRDGIPKILNAMMELTECLKQHRLIKGGKIAHYKRMFSNVNYYIDKYDMMTGRKDDTKEFIKQLSTNTLSPVIIKVIEDMNVYGFITMEIIEKILNDVPFDMKEIEDEVELIKCILVNLKLIEQKGNSLETTKKGRAFSRLSIEERYAGLFYLFDCIVNWEEIGVDFGNPDEKVSFRKISYVFSSIFSKKNEVVVSLCNLKDIKEQSIIIEISSERFRIARLESMVFGNTILTVCFEGMGLFKRDISNEGELVYRVTQIGTEIFKILNRSSRFFNNLEINNIGWLIQNRKYDEAEGAILEYLATFGESNIAYDYLGQLLMIKKEYKHAYEVLKYAYEKSSKRGKTVKSLLYHLVLCCQKLKYKSDIDNYQGQLQVMGKV